MPQLEKARYRLLTRSNFDGIVSAVLLKKAGLIDEIHYLHPQEIERGDIRVTPHDIVTNLPYTEGAHMVFDYMLREPRMRLNRHHALFTDAGSVSEVIYDYYGGAPFFGSGAAILVDAASRAKEARFTKEDVVNPQGWNQVIFMSDPRSHLGRHKTFRISNYALMQKLPDLCMEADIETVLNDPDVRERVDLCRTSRDAHIAQLRRTTRLEEALAVVDLREETEIVPGNRFMLYTLFPEVGISIHLLPAKAEGDVTIALGKSIFNRRDPIDLSEIAHSFGGGGNQNAATCQVAVQQVDRVVREIKKSVEQKSVKAEALHA